MEMEVPSFLTLEPSNGFDLSAMENNSPPWKGDLSDQVLLIQGAACSMRNSALQDDVIRQEHNLRKKGYRR